MQFPPAPQRLPPGARRHVARKECNMLDRRRFSAAAATVGLPVGCGPGPAVDRIGNERFRGMRDAAPAWVAYLRVGSAPPADVVAPDGTPLWSWRVHVLPFPELGETYHALKLDEPWNGPHDAPLAARPIRGPRLQWPGDPPGTTRIQAVRYADTPFPHRTEGSAVPNPPRLVPVAVEEGFRSSVDLPGGSRFFAGISRRVVPQVAGTESLPGLRGRPNGMRPQAPPADGNARVARSRRQRETVKSFGSRLGGK